jgi:hypothetical protein
MLYFSHNVVIEHNEFVGCAAGVFPKGGNNDGITIRYNLIRNGQTGVRVTYSGIATAPVRIYQNVIRDPNPEVADNNSAIKLAEYANYVDVVNNTIYNVSRAINFGNDTAQSNIRIRNNIVSASTSGVYTEAAGVKNFVIDNNTYHGVGGWFYGTVNAGSLSAWQNGINDDRASTTNDPLFQSASARDFRLAANSPARSGGVDILDLDGDNSTSNVIPRGAYVTGTEIIGPVSSENPPLPPAIPGALRRR